ncbi:hypothetical protein [Hymenobacter bucti]|uniref:Lipoprotein n=1 Tax=Hymenobacter bucti TaxID=1844114 RepID=A0ABW4R0B9_9BACT
MKIIYPIALLLIFSSLSACTSITEEAGFKAVADFYGGNVSMKKGTGISTTATEPQGSYLEVDLTTPGIGKYYRDMQLPASNCAYLVYKHLRPRERAGYNYFKVVIQDSAAAHSYTFSPADLELATQSIENFNMLMFKLQAADYPAVLRHLDAAALGTMSHDSVTANLRRISKGLAPFSSYLVQGFEVKQTPLAGQAIPIVRFSVSVSRVQKSTVPLFVYINPKPQTPQFLCGLRLL